MKKLFVIAMLVISLFLLFASPISADEPAGNVGAVICSPVGIMGQGGYGCYTWPTGYRETVCTDGQYTWFSSMQDFSCIGRYFASTFTW